jgi:two-component system, chemotaxis family, chemotaxis protein CheY
MAAENLSEARILLLARKSTSTRILRTVFSIAGLTKIACVDDPAYAIELLCTEQFDAIFMEGWLEHDGMPFALAARRLPKLRKPTIAMFAVFPEARKRDVEAARDLGVHDVICRPISPRTVMTKLRSVLDAPRPFIAAPGFFGPDRRSKARVEARAPGWERRARVAKKTNFPLR